MGLILICLALAAACNGVMDTLQFKWYESIFDKYPKIFNPQYWNPVVSWKNKWRKKEGKYVDWHKERFWGSSRWFVALTDGWHMMQWWMITFFGLAIQISLFMLHFSTLKWWLATLITQILVHATWGLSFSLFYEILLRDKKK